MKSKHILRACKNRASRTLLIAAAGLIAGTFLNSGTPAHAVTTTWTTDTAVTVRTNDTSGDPLALIAADGVTVTFRDILYSVASGDAKGGAIYSAGDVSLGTVNSAGTLIFSNNKVTSSFGFGFGYGGAIYSAGDVTLSGGTNTFSGNSATGTGTGGGYGYGGAIYSRGVITLSGGTNTFSGNSATGSTGGRGGAIAGTTVTISGGTNTFSGNSASITGTGSAEGGAIWGNVTISGGNTAFINNSVTGITSARGGAIFGGNVTLGTAAGNSVYFSGNTAAGAANSVFIDSNQFGAPYSLTVNGAGLVDMRDPFDTRVSYSTIAITKSGTGTWKLGGANKSQYLGAGSAFNLNEGTLDLYKDASITLAAGTAALANGATLVSRGGNTITAPTVNVAGGAVLGFDLTGATAGETTNLTLNAGTTLSITGAINLDILAFNGTGTFNLVTLSGDGTFAPANLGAITTRGEAIAGTRAAGTLTPDIINVGKTLTLGTSVTNGVVAWTGNDTTNPTLWNATASNWAGQNPGNGVSDLTGATQFLHGDAVKFDGTGSAIVIQDRGVQIAARGTNPGMEIAGGDWTFTGGAIEGGAINFTGTGSLTFGGEKINGADTGKRSVTQRITGADDVTVGLLAADGATVTMENFADSDAGAVIYAPGGVTLGAENSTGTLIFKNNNAPNWGGAIWGDTVTFSGGTNTFTGNAVTLSGGGAICGNAVTLSGGTNTFTGNSAGTWGGAIRGNPLTISGGTNTFTDNSADYGGAIESDIITISGGTNTFKNNSAGTNGGAIYGRTVTLSGGTNTFSGNSAGGNGGAIYVNDTGTFIAKDGDLTFRGNTDSTGPNAIYAENSWNGNTLTLGATDTGTAYFYDPIASNSGEQNLTIKINPDAEHVGTVLFDKYQSKVYGNTTVSHGIMALTTGATFGANDNTGSFTLGAAATLLSDAKGNGIKAGAITLEDGATLAFDMTGAVAGTTTNLKLSGASLTGDAAQLKIDLRSLASAAGTYTLVDASGVADISGLANYAAPNPDNLTYRGEKLFTAGGALINSRTAITGLTIDPVAQLIQFTQGAPSANGLVVWTNAAGTGAWNISDKNWDTSAVPGFETSKQFLHGDAVKFAGTGGTVDINAGGAVIAARGTNPGMAIAGGDWKFTGGAITGATGTETIYFAGSGKVTFGGEIVGGTDTGKRSLQQRITGASGVTVGLIAADGATVTMENFAITGDAGAAIRTLGSVTLGAENSTGTLLFKNNKATGGNGGAIYGNNVTLSGGTNTFSGNSAGGTGGAISGSYITLARGMNTFSGNSAGNLGGAIYGSIVTLSGDTNIFEGNSGGYDGGAIYGGTNVVITGGTNVFSGNSVISRGGAIFSNTDVNITGGSNTFENNKTTFADSVGGAIFVYDNGTFIADKGDLTFRGNTADGVANAIYAGNWRNDKTLQLGATNSGTAYFYDPIASNSTAPNLTIKINPDAEHVGTVLFDKYQSNVYGNTTVSHGVLSLTSGATFGANDNTGSFTLGAAATLLSDAKGNAIKAGAIVLENGATLAFDMTGAVAGTTTNLKFSGATLTGDASQLKIDLRTLANAAGTYTLADAAGVADISGLTNYAVPNPANFTYRGEAIFDGTFTPVNERVPISGLAINAGGNKLIQLTQAAAPVNGVVVWTNDAGTGKWNISDKNWNTSLLPSSSNQFLHGDTVIFDDGNATPGTVDINAGGVVIASQGGSAMEIAGGDWTFTGGAIKGATGTETISFSANGSLTFGGETINGIATDKRSVTQRITGADDVTVGLLAADGATVTMENFAVTGDAGAAIRTLGSVTLGAENSTGTLLFKNNKVPIGSFGGAIYGGTVTLSGGTNSFSGNSGGNNGGAICGSNVTLSGETNSFEGNSAGYDGGAIYGRNITLSGGTNVFSGNSAGSSGGAICGSYDVNITGGSNTFENNKATFADSVGGAIFVYDNGTFIADKGDLTFRGNTADGVANAIYAGNWRNDKTLQLGATNSGTAYFYDPIASNSTAPNLTIKINPDAEHVGTVLFDKYQSNVYGNTTVSHGVLSLTSGATFGANTNTGSFTLGAAATLLSDAKGNGIKAGAIALEDGATLAFDMTGAVKSGAAGATTNLTLSGTSTTAGTIGAGAINLTDFSGAAGEVYTLVSGNADDVVTTGALKVNNVDHTIPVRSATAGALMYALAKNTDASALQIAAIDATENTTVTWTGATDGVWDAATTANWTGTVGAVPVKTFLNNDNAVFNTADNAGAEYDIAIAAGGVTVNTLTVTGGAEYTLSGGNVTATGDVNVNGVSWLTLENELTADTGVTVSGLGALQIGNGGTTGKLVGAVDVDNISDLIFYRSDAAVNVSDLVTGDITGDGFIWFIGTLNAGESGYMADASTATFTGLTTIDGARLTLTGDGSGVVTGGTKVLLNSSLYLANGATYANTVSIADEGWAEADGSRLGALRLGDGATLTGDLTLLDNARITATGTDVGTISGKVSDNASGYILEKTGTGTIILSNAGNDYSGGTNLAEGTLQIGASGALGTGAINGTGTLALDNAGEIGAFFTAAQAGGNFAGTVRAQNGTTLTISALAADTAEILARTTLTLAAGGTAKLDADTTLNGIDLAGGTAEIAMNGPRAAYTHTATSINISDTTSKLVLAGLSLTGAGNVSQNQNYLDIELTQDAQLLIAGTVTGATKQLDIVDENGASFTGTDTRITDDAGITATYGFVGIAPNKAQTEADGLYYDYQLKSLEVGAGETLVLDIAGTTGRALAAEIKSETAGAGIVEVFAGAAADALTLTHDNSNFTGEMQAQTGTLIAGATNALGTGTLVVSSGASVEAGAYAQTLASLENNGTVSIVQGFDVTVTDAFASTGTLNLANGTTLILQNGGTLDGVLTGTGKIKNTGGNFVSNIDITGGLMNSGTATIAGDILAGGLVNNTGGTVTSVGAIVGDVSNAGEITQAGAITGNVANSGAMASIASITGALNNTASGATANVLGNVGNVTGNLGTLTIGGDVANGVNNSGVATISGGILAGGLTNNAGGIANVSGGVVGNIVNSGNALIIGEVLGNVVNNGIANITGGIDGSVTNNASGLLNFHGTTQVVTGRVINTGEICLKNTTFYTFTGGFENNGKLCVDHFGTTVNLGALSGTGVIQLDIDFADATNTDRLLATTVSGSHVVIVNNHTGDEAVKPGFVYEIIEGATYDAASVLTLSKPLNVGLYQLNIVGAGSSTLQVTGYSAAGQAIVNTTGAVAMGWFSQLDNLTKRMGELRLSEADAGAATGTTGSFWTRAYGQQVNASLGITGMSDFKEYQYGADVGANYKLTLDETNAAYFGVFTGYQGATRRFHDGFGSKGNTDSVYGGVYGTWIHADGWYADGVIKGQYFSNDYKAAGDKGDFDNYGLGASIELGKQFRSELGWFAEPSVQFAYTHIFADSYTTDQSMRVLAGDSDIYRFAGGIRFGKNVDLGTGGTIQPYAKIGVEQQISDGGSVRIASEKFEPNTDGTRMTYGAGIIWQLDAAQQIHLDYEGAFGDKYDKPWGVNAGYRVTF